MHKKSLKKILKNIRDRKISLQQGIQLLKELPYVDLRFAKLDAHRALRRGFPEVIFAEGKTLEQIGQISGSILAREGILFITRADQKVFNYLKKTYPSLKYHPLARIIYNKKLDKRKKGGKILIVSAGTADLKVAEEARLTLEVMGCKVGVLYDVGVAGIHRLLDKIGILNKAAVIIVVAGMEGALASVVSGLVSKPVIAVPTSVGYGASFKGIAPLLTMLNSCSPGIGVVNIDNGFGAGYLASLIIGNRE
ncbi:MAG: 1-(5-phosphoribosyl)-5-amino-4-imidazole-carboxylate carboxylase [Candidatus Omnitrophica bacterium CG07_land_8_20_14_0_80_42_15]|uniref:1-(5-phosphoribosyl)-5-amino-4-imidazole-carboxylate carboxylase n=1 Tax=Candidatus Aquitaenariimonas noxiae TaxID=1974741 RepID=A0A2J0KU55_9BACT|nr:MAG: 1-(5-phosphoribosyl)-5-amino-4-imidazole-carboxylate carboxylase [Candidatus Omnitrophica bacterium CG07_land_8_20_14_0_80_42_15]